MSINDEYYVMEVKFDDTYPLLTPFKECPHTYGYVNRNIRVDIPEITEFQLRHPIPRKPAYGDYLEALGKPIVSDKIENILSTKDIFGVQFIPSVIHDNKGDILENYFFMNIYNQIMAVDREVSKYDLVYDDNPEKFFLDTLSLKEEVISEVPLEERLMFLLKENSRTKIVHQSIVDIIMSINPKGVKFTPIKEWAS